MNIKIIAKFIYWNVIPISIGTVVFYYLNKTADINQLIPIIIKAFGFSIIFIMIHAWIGSKIFPERMTLADKIMRCKLRRKYGNSYCVDCQDSYACPTDIEGKGIISEKGGKA